MRRPTPKEKARARNADPSNKRFNDNAEYSRFVLRIQRICERFGLNPAQAARLGV
jgi:hypothetical protein